MLKPVVTKPNTLPLAPGGVTARTIMSRDGATTPENKPASAKRLAVTASGGNLAGARDRLVGGLFANQTYLNIHTSRFPGGEIRGNLVAAVPEPATWGMMILGFGAIGYTLRLSRRRMSLSSGLTASS